jgi:alpha/beta superfamily hydrolase
VTIEIRANTELPARREPVTLHTLDGLALVGEWALPLTAAPAATVVTFHPLPTAGGFMDSHVIRKAALRLPALADLAVLRFNTRGTSSPHGTSEGSFDEARAERFDVEAALDAGAGLARPPLVVVGWSFGTDLVLKFARRPEVDAVVLLSPALRFTSEAELAAWAEPVSPGRGPVPMVVLVPEHDDYLRPPEAQRRFAVVPQATVTPIASGQHLWVGEKFVRIALDTIASVALGREVRLPEEWRSDPEEAP